MVNLAKRLGLIFAIGFVSGVIGIDCGIFLLSTLLHMRVHPLEAISLCGFNLFCDSFSSIFYYYDYLTFNFNNFLIILLVSLIAGFIGNFLFMKLFRNQIRTSFFLI